MDHAVPPSETVSDVTAGPAPEEAWAGLELHEATEVIYLTQKMQASWYRETYPDVVELGMSAAEHYLKYGARMGRNPGRDFDTAYYLERHPEVAERGLNPLLHYALEGARMGVSCQPLSTDPDRVAQRDVSALRGRLLTLGFTQPPLAELTDMAQTHPRALGRVLAARELGLWRLRQRDTAGLAEALEWFAQAATEAPNAELRDEMVIPQVLCHYFAGDIGAALTLWTAAWATGAKSEPNTDLLLLRASLVQSGVDERMNWINRALVANDIAPIGLLPADGRPGYDRLDGPALPAVETGPKVTVLIAAYNAAGTISTALRALLAQTWRALEIIVLDDCSTDGGATAEVVRRFMAQDPRIRLEHMPRNGGAYVARNHGLALATGDYVTLHDADDWSHPAKIEHQVRFLEANMRKIGCLSQQARISEDLTFTRWTGIGRFVIPNTSSFMFRRRPVIGALGGWDTVRVSADSELIRRIRAHFGRGTVTELRTGPYSFQRDSDSSAVADSALGINGFLFGARKEYYDAQQNYHRTGRSLRYEKDRATRPFPAPGLILSDRPQKTDPRHIPVIIGTDLRMEGGSVQSTLEELRACHAAGIPTAIFETYRYDLKSLQMLDHVRDELHRLGTRILTYGETVSCDILLLRYPPALAYPQRWLPTIQANKIKVIVNQPPMSDYSPEGVLRYRLADCTAMIRDAFGAGAVWYPIGPLIRDALNDHHAEDLHHITLSDTDWSNVIDVAAWQRPSGQRGPGTAGPIRIGRHSRDSAVKWPDTIADLTAAYPSDDDIAVHVLGGAETPRDILGGLPDNWHVSGFGSQSPQRFLAELDFFVYFTHPDWIESFGRTIIEAMAVGVPVILPEVYRPLFGEAAIYATPQTALAEVRRLWAAPEQYHAQVEAGLCAVRQRFSHQHHITRIRAEMQG